MQGCGLSTHIKATLSWFDLIWCSELSEDTCRCAHCLGPAVYVRLVGRNLRYGLGTQSSNLQRTRPVRIRIDYDFFISTIHTDSARAIRRPRTLIRQQITSIIAEWPDSCRFNSHRPTGTTQLVELCRFGWSERSISSHVNATCRTQCACSAYATCMTSVVRLSVCL